MNEKLRPIRAQLRRQFRALYGPRLARLLLYGSQARGDARPDSDIDILVVLNGQVNPGMEIARACEITAPLSLLYDVVISCAFVSVERFHHEQSPFLINVRKEGVAL